MYMNLNKKCLENSFLVRVIQVENSTVKYTHIKLIQDLVHPYIQSTTILCDRLAFKLQLERVLRLLISIIAIPEIFFTASYSVYRCQLVVGYTQQKN